MKQHKRNTKDFDELSFSEHAKSINAEILYVKRAIISGWRVKMDGAQQR